MTEVPPVDTECIKDDWKRELTQREALARMHRVSGDQVCPKCGYIYYDHPVETRVLDREGRPFLVRLCNGWLGKL